MLNTFISLLCVVAMAGCVDESEASPNSIPGTITRIQEAIPGRIIKTRKILPISGQSFGCGRFQQVAVDIVSANWEGHCDQDILVVGLPVEAGERFEMIQISTYGDLGAFVTASLRVKNDVFSSGGQLGNSFAATARTNTVQTLMLAHPNDGTRADEDVDSSFRSYFLQFRIRGTVTGNPMVGQILLTTSTAAPTSLTASP